MCDYWRVSKQFQTSIWANLPIKFLNLNVSGILRDTSLIQSPSHFGKDSMEFPTGQNQYTQMTLHQPTVSQRSFELTVFRLRIRCSLKISIEQSWSLKVEMPLPFSPYKWSHDPPYNWFLGPLCSSPFPFWSWVLYINM